MRQGDVDGSLRNGSILELCRGPPLVGAAAAGPETGSGSPHFQRAALAEALRWELAHDAPLAKRKLVQVTKALETARATAATATQAAAQSEAMGCNQNNPKASRDGSDFCSKSCRATESVEAGAAVKAFETLQRLTWVQQVLEGELRVLEGLRSACGIRGGASTMEPIIGVDGLQQSADGQYSSISFESLTANEEDSAKPKKKAKKKRKKRGR